MSTTDSLIPDSYAQFLIDLKDHVRSARVQAQRIVNTALIDLYWNIGTRILAEQERQGWGSSVITRLAEDLRREFPDMTGLSRSNVHYMRAFAAAWPDWNPKVPQPVGHLPWSHIRVLLDKNLPLDSRNWYAGAAAEHGSGTVIGQLDAGIKTNEITRLDSLLKTLENLKDKNITFGVLPAHVAPVS